jgi:hypothetical protein
MDKDSYLIFEAMYGEAISLNTDPNAEFRSQSGGMGGTESTPSLKPKVEDDGMGGYKQSLKDAGAFAIEAAKFLDPTGILSWGDVKDAYNQFVQTKSPFDGTMLVLAVGSVIPVGGKFVKPIQVAAKSTNKIDQVGGLIKSLFKQFEDILIPPSTATKNYPEYIMKNDQGFVGRPTGRKYDTSQLQTQPTYTQGSFDSNNAQLIGQPTGKKYNVGSNQQPQQQATSGFSQQLTQNGINVDILQEAFEKAISSANETQKMLARVVGKTSPQQQIPDMSKFRKTINSRWNYGSMSYSDAERMVDGLVQKIDNMTKGLQFDPSKIKVLDYDFFGNSRSARQIMELELPNGGKFLIYSSGTGTSGKNVGSWYVVGGFADILRWPNTERAQNGWLMKTEDSVKLTEGGNKYLTDLANYLETYGAAALTGDYKY